METEGNWRTSSYCAHESSCVEVNTDTDGMVGLRDSKAVKNLGETAAPVLFFTSAEWNAFLSGAKAGEFNLADSQQ